MKKYTFSEWAKGYIAWVALSPIYLLLGAYASVFKRLPDWLTRKLLLNVRMRMAPNPMDTRIPPVAAIPAYMLRWWWLPRNAFFNVYLHKVLRGDDDRALHDHPWWSFSIVLSGGYTEHMIVAGGTNSREWFGPGSVRFRRSGKIAHRLELPVVNGEEQAAVTIFITGPVLRRWGFCAPEKWVDAYEWDAYCESNGIQSMPMAGGSDASPSERNKI